MRLAIMMKVVLIPFIARTSPKYTILDADYERLQGELFET